MTQAMTNKARRAPGGRWLAQCPCFPFDAKGQAQARYQAKVTILVQRDQDQPDGQMEVTVEPKAASSPVLLATEDHLWSG